MLRGRPLLQLWVGAASIGVAPVLAKLSMLAGVGPTAVAVWRCGLAGLVLIPLLPRGAFRGQLAWLLLPGLLFALDIVTFHQALARTAAGHATLLTNLQVFVVGAYGAVRLKERVRLPFFAGAALSFSGLVLLLDVDLRSASAEAFVGDLIALGAMFFYAAYLVGVRAARERFGVEVVMVTSSLGAAAWAAPVAVLHGESWIPDSTFGWVTLVLLALVGHALGQGSIARAAPHVPVSTVGLVLLLQPVIASVVGALFLGEALGPVQVAAMAIVLVGIELARRYGSAR